MRAVEKSVADETGERGEFTIDVGVCFDARFRGAVYAEFFSRRNETTAEFRIDGGGLITRAKGYGEFA